MKKLTTIILTIGVVSSVLILGCAEEKKGIKIGVITPLSGASAKYGEDIKRGYDMAVEEINENGGIKGRKIKLTYEDSEGKPEKAVSAAQKLINQDKVIAILGALWSSPTLAVAPIAEKNKVVLLSSGSSSPEITKAGDYIFRNEISDELGATEGAKHYYNLGYKKIAGFYVNNDYGVGYRDITRRIYVELGGTVTISEMFEQDATDFRTQLLKIKDTEPDAILIVSYKEAILILKQMEELGIKKQVLGSTLFEDAEIVEKLGKTADGVIYVYYGTFDPESEDRIVVDFLNKFRSKYKIDPGYYAPIGYDAANILGSAMQKGGFSSEGIKTALYSTRDFPGISGSTSFDQNGDVIKPVVLKTINKGKFVKYER